LSILRVSKSIENIGERIAMSKKRVTWTFEFTDSQRIHTVILEHSRLSSKKRVKVDGESICKQEKFASGDWVYSFSFNGYEDLEFIISIKDTTKKVNKSDTDDAYNLLVNNKLWEDYPERQAYQAASAKNSNNAKTSDVSLWGSESFARRISFSQERLSEEEYRATWIFTFGREGDIHKLILDHQSDNGEICLVLDRREICRNVRNPESGDDWSFDYTMEPTGHKIHVGIIRDANEADSYSYRLFLNGSPWNDIAQTDYVLQSNWNPVHSKSTGKVYYRNDALKLTQWSKPILARDDPLNRDQSTKNSEMNQPATTNAAPPAPEVDLINMMDNVDVQDKVADEIDLLS